MPKRLTRMVSPCVRTVAPNHWWDLKSTWTSVLFKMVLRTPGEEPSRGKNTHQQTQEEAEAPPLSHADPSAPRLRPLLRPTETSGQPAEKCCSSAIFHPSVTIRDKKTKKKVFATTKVASG